MSLHTYFLIVPPGFETLAVEELKHKGLWGEKSSSTDPAIRYFRGGVEFDLDAEAGHQINQLSKIGTRVLERIERFRCRDFPKLFKKTKDIPWSKYLKSDFSLSVSAGRSRLMNKKRISETVTDAIEKHGFQYREDAAKCVYVRFEDDEVEFSLDLSGEALFKRGYKELTAKAPLRENLAAALFFRLFEGVGGCDYRSGEQLEVLDLTCGTGTLLTEAALFFEPTVISKAWGFDRDPAPIKTAERNFSQISASARIHLEKRDFLIDSIELNKKKHLRLGLSNPPYGKRIRFPVSPKKFYEQLVRVYRSADCDIFGFIVPAGYSKLAPKPDEKLAFKNGGLDVVFHIYR